ncbi:MAG: alpha-L-fucosidase, partial [Promethearchaeia archaeon]
VLWNDIAYPPGADLYELFAYFYNRQPEGVIDDRWSQYSKWVRRFLKFKPIKALVTYFVERAMTQEGGGGGKSLFSPPCDFVTPEYAQFDEIKEIKWEANRGIGNSFGYNRAEAAEDYLASDKLIRIFVDIVSKNGNLLLNVGPKADGSIPKEQKEVLLALGEWLKVNGEGIFGTRPWKRAEGKTEGGISLRFTQKQKKNTLFLFLMENPDSETITVHDLRLEDQSNITLLGNKETLRFSQLDSNVEIDLPGNLQKYPVYTFKITPLPY